MRYLRARVLKRYNICVTVHSFDSGIIHNACSVVHIALANVRLWTSTYYSTYLTAQHRCWIVLRHTHAYFSLNVNREFISEQLIKNTDQQILLTANGGISRLVLGQIKYDREHKRRKEYENRFKSVSSLTIFIYWWTEHNNNNEILSSWILYFLWKNCSILQKHKWNKHADPVE